MGYQKATSQFNIPRSTFRDRVEVAVTTEKNASDAAEKEMGRFKTVFTKEQDEELVYCSLEMETKLFGIARIFNCDETSISTVSKHQSKIIAKKGRNQVGALSSVERGQLVTTEICLSATGQYIPPMLIFSRQRMKQELMDGALLGAVSTSHQSDWKQGEIFVK
ncbi:hypothetical protein ILUMI_24483 [Ignelater luminosus]|uniref:Uncharacterized protein n=1 Tax=Ignelater luminosus TaxID=2038154 RepID=A0A8K0G0L9_IGNLU|nr:hypothetical protein ILUMI_24483 [Ignelater luminosus]